MNVNTFAASSSRMRRRPSCAHQGRRYQATAPPTPIDAMMTDQSAHDLHDLDEMHLVALRRLPWVLPDEQAATVGQPIARAIPAHEVVGSTARALVEESAQLAAAA